jgi:hypothetical protein
MRVILFTLLSLLFSSMSFGSTEAQLQKRIDDLKKLQDRITKECINNPHGDKYSVKMDGRTLKCPDLIIAADLLRKKLDEDIQKHREKCEAEAKKSPHTKLATQAATIAQKSVACQPSPDKDQCLGKLTCAMISPVAAVAGLLGNSEAKKCAAEAKNLAGIPACVENLARGIFDAIWSFVGLIWDAGKWAATSIAEWTGLIRESEAKTSEKLMMAQQASPGFLKQFSDDPVGVMKKMASDLFATIEEAAINHYGCQKWSGAPYVSTCLSPMETWDCGTCQQKAQVWCGIGGYAVGEIGSAFLTGGIVSGAKIALKGAVRVGAGPAKNIADFLGKTFPKATTEVSEAAAKVKLLAAAGLSGAQYKLFSAWQTISNSEVTKAIATAARKTGVAQVTSIALKPIGAYLSAMDRAFVAGMDGVDHFAKSTKAIAGAKIAEEALEVNRGLVVESTADASKAPTRLQSSDGSAQRETTQPGSTPQVKTQQGDAQTVLKTEDMADISKYRTDPEYLDLFKGPEMYRGHHEELGTVIRELEKVSPPISKEQIRKKIQDTLNSCSL